MNRAITARFATYEKKLDTKLSDSFSGFEAKLAEFLTAKTEETKAPNAEAAKPPQSIEEHPQFRGLQKQLSEYKNKVDAITKSAAEAEARSKDVTLRQKLGEMLAEQGIDGVRAKHAVGYLVDAEKRVRYAEDGSPVFADANGEALDLATGLKGWMSGEDAKLYLPPRGAAGSGERPSNGAVGARGSAPSDPKADAQATLMAFFGHG